MQWKVPRTNYKLLPLCNFLEVLSFISKADYLVKDMARIFSGNTPEAIKYANLVINVSVLPVPTPAAINNGASLCSTASLY